LIFFINHVLFAVLFKAILEKKFPQICTLGEIVVGPNRFDLEDVIFLDLKKVDFIDNSVIGDRVEDSDPSLLIISGVIVVCLFPYQVLN
jgi:hypothetical protein